MTAIIVWDRNLITARFPYDLPRLVKALAKQLVPAKAQEQAA
jgi:protease I